ncbi:PrpF domain-containing protein [Tistrella bauzanensis]|uniref:2-methylaconitate cis-trans isomerase PrpF family protein n=1 Tax=Tistrella TaxID=171436 RepID=UPI0031F6891C
MQDDEVIEIPTVLMRGGTSKALFFHETDLPPAGVARDRLLLRAMGSPDLMQIDGLGGSRLVTSKVAIIRPSDRPDADVIYTFAQVDTDRAIIGYEGNCGNISSAVAPFAVNEGVVTADGPEMTVRIWNTNTDKILRARVQVVNGKARVLGDCAIPGVPGTGAPVMMDYADTVGAGTGRLFPSGAVAETLILSDGSRVRITLCDVGNPGVFIRAEDLGMDGSELPDRISADAALAARISEVQARAGVACGYWDDWRAVDRPGLPQALLVMPPNGFRTSDGQALDAGRMDVWGRMFFLGKCHDSMSGTGSMCFAAASAVPGTVVADAAGTGRIAGGRLVIGHPLGAMTVEVAPLTAADPMETRFERLGFARTARRLMAGTLYIPRDDWPEPVGVVGATG